MVSLLSLTFSATVAPMPARIRLTALASILASLAIAVPASAHTPTGHCANLKLGIHDTGPVQPPASSREPITHLTATELSCSAATTLLHGAKVTITGGGGNLGPAFGAKRSMSPRGWKCTFTTGYWAAKDHADTLDWISGWTEQCTAGTKVVTFDEGKVTAYHVSPSILG